MSFLSKRNHLVTAMSLFAAIWFFFSPKSESSASRSLVVVQEKKTPARAPAKIPDLPTTSNETTLPGLAPKKTIPSPNFTLFQENGKSGWKDENGNLVGNTLYDFAAPFTDGLSVVGLNGKYGFIDPKGNMTISSVYDQAWSFQEGRALVKIGNQFGYINTSGNLINPELFENTWGFTEGLAAVEVGEKFGYINTDGNWVIPATFDYAWPFKGGIAWVKMGKTAFHIDPNGRAIP